MEVADALADAASGAVKAARRAVPFSLDLTQIIAEALEAGGWPTQVEDRAGIPAEDLPRMVLYPRTEVTSSAATGEIFGEVWGNWHHSPLHTVPATDQLADALWEQGQLVVVQGGAGAKAFRFVSRDRAGAAHAAIPIVNVPDSNRVETTAKSHVASQLTYWGRGLPGMETIDSARTTVLDGATTRVDSDGIRYWTVKIAVSAVLAKTARPTPGEVFATMPFAYANAPGKLLRGVGVVQSVKTNREGHLITSEDVRGSLDWEPRLEVMYTIVSRDPQ